MQVKKKKLSIYICEQWNEDFLKKFIFFNKSISFWGKKRIIYNWNKTKWLIQKNFAEVVKRNKMDSPSSLEAISFYLKRNKLWSSSCQIPWGYFAASAAGLSPDSDFNWVITWGVKIDFTAYRPKIAIVDNFVLDQRKLNLVKKVLNEKQGKLFFTEKIENAFFLKLPKEFDQTLSIFPLPQIDLPHRIPNSEKKNILWRKFISDIEIEWHKINDKDKQINSLWAWGWGSMPSSLGFEFIPKNENSNESYKDEKIISLVISGLLDWLKQVKKKDLDIAITKIDFADNNIENERTKEILKIEFNKTSKIITEFNSQINCNIDDEIILIGNNFVLQKTKSIVLSRFQKLKIFFYAAMSALFNKF